MSVGRQCHEQSKNDEKALEFYNKACDIDHTEPCYEIGLIYSQKKEKKKAREFFKIACDGGMKKACKKIGK